MENDKSKKQESLIEELVFQIIKLMEKDEDDNSTIQKQIVRTVHFLEDYLNKNDLYDEAEKEKRMLHSLQVTLRLATWKQNIHAVQACILHMLAIEESGKVQSKSISLVRKYIDVPTADILWQYYLVKKRLLQAEEMIHIGSFEQERLSDTLTPEVLYIIIAHRIEELNREADTPSPEILKTAQATKEYLIPEIQSLGAYDLADQLEELCFKITNRAQYENINKRVQDMQAINYYAYELFRDGMQALFSPDNEGLPMNLRKYQAYISRFLSRPRSFNSMYRFLTNMKQADDLKTIKEYGLALYELTLVIRDPVKPQKNFSPVSIFLKFYAELSKNKRIQPQFTIHGLFPTIDPKTNAFLITDQSDNFYRLFVRTESEYQHYLYGDYESEQEIPEEIRSSDMIRVHKKDGEIVEIQKGSTVLDFAFLIHKKLGLNYSHARVNEVKVGIHYKLKQGDQVEIVVIKGEKDNAPELSWLRYANTQKARQELVKHFIRHYEAKEKATDSKILITRGDGSQAEVDAGTTILDYAFETYGHKALTFQKGLLKKDHFPCRINYELRNNDLVEIEFSSEYTATLDWFKYVNTEKAKDILITYFKQSSEPSQ